MSNDVPCDECSVINHHLYDAVLMIDVALMIRMMMHVQWLMDDAASLMQVTWPLMHPFAGMMLKVRVVVSYDRTRMDHHLIMIAMMNHS